MSYRSRETYVVRMNPSMLVNIPRMNEKLARTTATLYRILQLVKRQILRDVAIQFGIALVYLYTCLNPR